MSGGLSGRTIDIDAIVDGQKLGWLAWSVVLWSFLLMVLDGFDIQALSVSAPQVIRAWHVDPATIGPMLSASNFGVLFGAPLFGWIGDRYGRKPAILTAGTTFGVFTLATVLVGSVDQMALLRFFAGVGIAGVLGNTIALTAEMAPVRARATMVILMFCGNTLGGAVPGLIAPWSFAHYGWPALFVIGGALPLLLVALLAFVLPESIKFLGLDPARRERTERMARRMAPGLGIGTGDRLVMTLKDEKLRGSFADLFRGRFAVITPLIWALFAINLMVFYFAGFWLPTVVGPALVRAGGSADTAGYALAMFQIGGTLGGLVLSRFIDRFGLKPVLFYFVIGGPFIFGIGYSAAYAQDWLLPAAFMAGFGALGAQFGLNAGAGIIYPTHIRANGVGWAFGVGRFGAVLGPILGGTLMAAHVGVDRMYLFAASPYVVSFLAALVLIRLVDRSRPAARAMREVPAR